MGLKMGQYQTIAPNFNPEKALRTHTRILAVKVKVKAKCSCRKMVVSDHIYLVSFILNVDVFFNRTRASCQTQWQRPWKNIFSRSRKGSWWLTKLWAEYYCCCYFKTTCWFSFNSNGRGYELVKIGLKQRSHTCLKPIYRLWELP